MAKLSNAVVPVEDAIVQERQVSVQVLTITKKQVTQTMYRQLVEEDLIDRKTGELNGTPWGWVNLHVDCNNEKKYGVYDHLHVIWEDKGKIKKAITGHRAYIYKYSAHHGRIEFALGRLLGAYVGLLALSKKNINGQEGRDKITLKVKGRYIGSTVPQAVSEFLSRLPPYQEDLKSDLLDIMSLDDGMVIPNGMRYSGVNREFVIPKIRWELNNFSQRTEHLCSEIMSFVQNELSVAGYPDKVSKEFTYQHVYHLMENAADELNTIERNWEQSYKKIEDAGQLFVAISGVWK